jgi:hypothetical protein
MDDQEKDDRRTVPFADTLQQLQGGRTARELADILQQMTEAVTDTGKAATLVLTIKMTKSKAAGMVEIADTVRAKLPEADRPVSLFFATPDSNLSRDNPRQAELPLGPIRVSRDDVERAAQ